MNRFVLLLAAVVVVFFGLLFFNKKDTSAPGTDVTTSTHTQGTGKVVLMEYGDFECPHCARFFPVIKQVQEKYGDKITFQFRNFPLSQLHKNAVAAHRAAEAANKQGKFFEMYDLLFSGQNTWAGVNGFSTSQAEKTFEGYAQQIGLNMDQYRQDVGSSAVNDIIQADIKAGQELRITSTPTFVLDGVKLEDARDSVDYFSEKIDAALAASQPQ